MEGKAVQESPRAALPYKRVPVARVMLDAPRCSRSVGDTPRRARAIGADPAAPHGVGGDIRRVEPGRGDPLDGRSREHLRRQGAGAPRGGAAKVMSGRWAVGFCVRCQGHA